MKRTTKAMIIIVFLYLCLSQTPLVSTPSKQTGSSSISSTREQGTVTSTGTITEASCLGPCEPGTSVTLDGVVWQETEGGVLVVNVTWREKSYVGTLLDCTKHDWAPPRLCDSPSEDTEKKGRGKRRVAELRKKGGRRTGSTCFTIPVVPDKKTSKTDCPSSPKRSRTRNDSSSDLTHSPALIECPEPNCNKKYKHINGLKYHQTHAHEKERKERMMESAMEREKEVDGEVDEEEKEKDGDNDGENNGENNGGENNGETDRDNEEVLDEKDTDQEAVKETVSKEAPSPAYSDISDEDDCKEDKDECKEVSSLLFRPTEDSSSSPCNSSRSVAYPFAYPMNGADNHLIEQKEEDKGMKPTMESTGPPPSSSSYYLHHSMNSFFPPVFRGVFNSPLNSSQMTCSNNDKNQSSPKVSPNDNDKACSPSNHDSKEPPPQRHLHTHHHTHVGVGVPYPAVVPGVMPGITVPTVYDPYGGMF